jgi:DNA-binding NarL/FixJ family response regulator
MACYLDLGTPIRVLVADDHPAVRDALVRVIASSSGAMVAGVACDTQDAIGLAEKIQPDVALLDVRMPGGGGDRAAREIRRLSPETAVVALSAYCDRATVSQMLKGGAISYLSKSASAEEIITSIRRAACGVSTFSPEVVTEVASGLARQMEATQH